VAPDNVPDLTAALDRLIADAELRRRMGSASRRLSEQRHSLTRCVAETERLFLSMFPGRPTALRVQDATVG